MTHPYHPIKFCLCVFQQADQKLEPKIYELFFIVTNFI